MRVLIFGGRGFIASHLRSIYPDAVLPETDITDAAAVAKVLEKERPDMMINAAGKTGRPNVDWCEDHKLETIMSNVAGPLVLLKVCAERGIRWVHIGSGCIYEGSNGGRGFTEDDPPNFSGSVYARSKLWSDQILKEFPACPDGTGGACPDGTGGVLQLRLRMPFDGSNHPRNLISKLKKYPLVLDEQNSLTYLPDFLSALQLLVRRRATGIYNIVSPGTISPYQIMQRYRQIVDPKHVCQRLTVDHLGSVVKTGRSNCILSTKKLEGEGIALTPVAQAVDEALNVMGAQLKN